VARKTVFLSSTKSDLMHYRQAAAQAIRRLGYYCEEMETFGASIDPPLEVCLSRVAACDIYVGILGHFYGSTPPGEDRSFTEIEFEAAVQAHKPCLLFLAPDDWTPLEAPLQTARQRTQQQAFRQRVMQTVTCDTFNNPEDLATRVTAALAHLERGRPKQRPAWLAAGAVVVIAVAAGIAALLGNPLTPGSPQPTATIGALATPTPAYEEFNDPILIGSNIHDVAARDGRAWFATARGLILRDETEGRTRQIAGVPGDLATVTLSADGQSVWYSKLGTGIGRFQLADETNQLLTADDGSPGTSVLHILPATDGTVWFADGVQEVFARTADGKWQTMPPFPTDRWRAGWLAFGPEQTIWAAASISVMRLRGTEWTAYDEMNTGGGLRQGIVSAIAADRFGQLWFAHALGLSILTQGALAADVRDQTWLNCDSTNSKLPAGEVMALTISSDGRAVWALTSNGLARIEASAAGNNSSCANWDWRVWPADRNQRGFWEGTGGFRIAVDDDRQRSRTTVWLVKRCDLNCADRVLKLVLPAE